MLILRQALFTKLEKYKDYDPSKMSKLEKLEALEEEDETAGRNTKKLARDRAWKGAGIGAAAGLGLAALGKRKGSAKSTGLPVALLGATGGALLGRAVGESKAKKDGHSRDERTKKLARKFDEYAREHGEADDYEIRNRENIRARREDDMARSQKKMAHYQAADFWLK